ncbi:hypothetical protein D3C81_946080 [compost metagenome]
MLAHRDTVYLKPLYALRPNKPAINPRLGEHHFNPAIFQYFMQAILGIGWIKRQISRPRLQNAKRRRHLLPALLHHNRNERVR